MNSKDFDKRTKLEIEIYMRISELEIGGYTKRRIAEVIVQEVLEKAARIHENINVACSHEEATHAPGAGAMGAVIKYRDAIRKLGSAPMSTPPRPGGAM